MILTFKNRLTILYAGLLPSSSDVTGIKLNKSIREKVAFSTEERKALSLQETGNGSFTYQLVMPLEAYSKEVELTAEEQAHLAQGAKRLNDNRAVTEDTMDTVERFI